MRQRTGFVLFLTGVILLWNPKVDTDQIAMTIDYMVKGYWPVGVMCMGIYLLAPKKKKKSKTR